MEEKTVTLTFDEAEALYFMIDELSGGNAANVFAHDGSDSMDDPGTSASVKVFLAAGREESVPENLPGGKNKLVK